MSQADRLTSVICLITASALWGGATVLNKALLSSVPPVPLLVTQLAASTICLAIFASIAGRPLPSLGAALPLMLLGVLNPGISYALGLVGLVHVPASTTTLIWAAEPIMIVAIAAIVLREHVSPRLVFVIAAGLLGVLLVTGVLADAAAVPARLFGVALLFGAVAVCAVYTVFSRMLIHTADPVATVLLQQAAGLGFALLLLLGTPWFGSWTDIFAATPRIIAAASLSGLMYYAIAYGLFLSALRYVPAGIASGYYCLIPFFGVGFAYVFLGERLDGTQLLGAAVIVASAVLLIRITGGRSPSPQG